MRRSVVLLFSIAPLFTAATAFPCVNPIRLGRDRSLQVLAGAERSLAAGRAEEAIKLLLGGHDPPGRFLTLDARAQERFDMLTATAALRAGLAHPMTVSYELGVLLAAHPDDPLLLARRAEAQSRFPEGHVRALATLADLERRDLIPDAEAWAALARLRAREGDKAGQDRALDRCRKIRAGFRGGKGFPAPSICVLDEPPPSKEPAPDHRPFDDGA